MDIEHSLPPQPGKQPKNNPNFPPPPPSQPKPSQQVNSVPTRESGIVAQELAQSIQSSHNLIVQKILSNSQIKFICFHNKLFEHSATKTLYRDGIEHRFVTALVVAGLNFVRLYVVFEQHVVEELVSYRVHENITGLYAWDRCVVVQTKQQVVGLIYEESVFKNAFMLSLEFLPLNQADECSCVFDKFGQFFVVQIRQFLLVCLSGLMIGRFKSRPLYKPFTEVVKEDVKWNRSSDRVYIEEIIKIKYPDLGLGNIQSLSICQESLYFVGLKNFEKPNERGEFYEKSFYYLHPQNFLTDNQLPVWDYLAKKDEDVVRMIPYVYNRQIECLFLKRTSVFIQIQQQIVLVDELQTEDYDLIHHSIVGQTYHIWVKVDRQIFIYVRDDSDKSKSKFHHKQFQCDVEFDKILIREQLLAPTASLMATGKPTDPRNVDDNRPKQQIKPLEKCFGVFCSQSELSILSFSKVSSLFDLEKKEGLNAKGEDSHSRKYSRQKEQMDIEEELIINEQNLKTIEKTFANIVDFQIEKNCIHILQSKNTKSEHSDDAKSKLYLLRRMLMTDPKPYVTHIKKNAIEKIISSGPGKVKKIQSFRFQWQLCQSDKSSLSSVPSFDNILVISENKYDTHFTFYKESDLNTSSSVIGSEIPTGESSFTKIEEDIFFYAYHRQGHLVLINRNRELYVRGRNRSELKQPEKTSLLLNRLQIDTAKSNEEVWLIGDLLVYKSSEDTFEFVNVLTHKEFSLCLPLKKEDRLVSTHLNRKLETFKRKDKDFFMVEVLLTYSNSLEIYEVSTSTELFKKSHSCENISKGLPILLNMNSSANLETLGKNKFRSITCPEHVLSEHHHSMDSKLEDLHIVKSFLYHQESSLSSGYGCSSQNQKTLLILVTNSGELMCYQKHLNFSNDIGYTFKRVLLPLNIMKSFKLLKNSRIDQNINTKGAGNNSGIQNEGEALIQKMGEGIVRIGNIVLFNGEFLQHNVGCSCYFQMDQSLWTVEKDKVKMVDLKVVGGSSDSLFKHQFSLLQKRKTSKQLYSHSATDPSSLSLKQSQRATGQMNYPQPQQLSDLVALRSGFIATPVRTMIRKQLMGVEMSEDYLVVYSKSGFEVPLQLDSIQVLQKRDYKSVWVCSFSAESTERKEIIVCLKAYGHNIAISYYDYLIGGSTTNEDFMPQSAANMQQNSLLTSESSFFKSIKFKFRIYNILSKTKLIEKTDKADEPILHIKPMSNDRVLLTTSSTVYTYQVKGDKAIELSKPRKFLSRYALTQFAYISEVYNGGGSVYQESNTGSQGSENKPGFMLFANQFGGLSFQISTLLAKGEIFEQWYEPLRCEIRNLEMFSYGQYLKALISDADRNLIVVDICPQNADVIADFNLGFLTNNMRCKNSHSDSAVYCCTQGGQVVSVSAVKLDNSEVSFLDFQDDFYKEIPLLGGFNTQGYRLLNQKKRTYKYVKRGNMLDCQILSEFFSMTSNLKEYITEKAELTIEDLKAIIKSI